MEADDPLWRPLKGAAERRSSSAQLYNCSNQPIKSKPYALPLRMPPSTTKVETHKLKEDTDEPKEHPKPDAFRDKRRMPSVERGSCTGSPQPRRAAKSTKASEEHKDTRIPSVVPLEQSEHDWLVKCAAGHWSQVYGLLLRDNQLAEKKDFMSGFTALHWAAKCGNSDMLVKIINTARQGGVHIDVNVKTHGGYTPLHIAALHDKHYIIGILVKEYDANISIRDNYGKKAYHYLHKDVAESVREMLCKPKGQSAQDSAVHEKDELDSFPDLPKGLHSITKLDNNSHHGCAADKSAATVSIWTKISEECVQHLVESMPQRVKTVYFSP
uniref:Uncharacterized protein n=1 Tax=Amphilophus citrinellus TaxID=61819 RepID=A0A3Q0RMD5_AMPCI